MATYIKIATVTVGSGGQASMDFTSIPSTYTDLLMKFSLRTDRPSTDLSGLRLTFNGATTNFSSKGIEGNGASAISYNGGTTSVEAAYAPASTATASTFNNMEIYIPNYAGSNNKSVSIDTVQENNITTTYANLIAGLWSNTAAITSIKMAMTTANNFVQYSTATLYGISKS